jgi:kinesin family protein 5
VAQIGLDLDAAAHVVHSDMNAESSRSHSIFLVTIQQRNTETGSQKTGNLYLVDLAGSEKVGKTGASGQTLEEAKKINKSLSALGMVINALTDGKVSFALMACAGRADTSPLQSSHIPYRDSKLTRILQESLGGNSRTTLIINCSPCAFNQDETISTLRFGVRAKSIKNKARVNAELSPAELKALLKKAQVDAARYQNYIAALEGELKQWRAGGTVPESDWAEVGKVAAGAEGLAAPAAARSATASPSVRPQTPAIEALLREGSSRPDTPTSSTLDKDERDEFLRRENELQDTIAKLENELEDVKAAERIARDELSSAREQEQSGKEMSQRLEECKLELDSVRHKLKEAEILNDVHADSIRELTVDVDELRKAASESTRNAAGAAGARDPGHEGKERKKAERMAKMMADFNAGIVSEKEEQIRETLAKLEIASGMGTGADGTLSADDISTLREQLLESQTLVREQHERVRQVQDENELLLQRRDEMEARLATLEAEYEELLDKTYHDGQDAGTAGINDAMLELRGKLEDQYASRREAQASEIADLKKQLELKAQERASMQAANDALRSTNDELKRAFAVTAAAAEGGKDLAESAREMERVRKTMATQLSEFDNMKKSLMRDLQNRCEKVSGRPRRTRACLCSSPVPAGRRAGDLARRVQGAVQ